MLKVRLISMGLAASIIVAAAAGDATAAAADYPRPCFAGVTVDYGKPLRDMPTIRRVENAGRFQLGGYDLGFAPFETVFVGPKRLNIRVSASRSRDDRSSAPIRLTGELIRITSSGEAIERAAIRHRLIGPKGKFRQEFEVGLAVPRAPSLYRVDLILETEAGRRVKFGEYLRVVKQRHSRIHGHVLPRIVPPGGHLRWLIENPGTDWMWPSTEFLVERLLDGQWIAAGDPVRLVEPQNILPGGLSFGCRYGLPSSLEPGQYRLMVSAGVAGKEIELPLRFEIVDAPSDP